MYKNYQISDGEILDTFISRRTSGKCQNSVVIFINLIIDYSCGKELDIRRGNFRNTYFLKDNKEMCKFQRLYFRKELDIGQRDILALMMCKSGNDINKHN